MLKTDLYSAIKSEDSEALIIVKKNFHPVLEPQCSRRL